jgi:hypothetical protein
MFILDYKIKGVHAEAVNYLKYLQPHPQNADITFTYRSVFVQFFLLIASAWLLNAILSAIRILGNEFILVF